MTHSGPGDPAWESMDLASCLVARVNHLLSKQEKCDAKTASLHLAVLLGNARVVQTLLDAAAEVDSKVEGYTVLHVAALYGDCAIVQVLMAAGADVDALTKEGMTALHFAASNGHEDVVRVLLGGAAGSEVGREESWLAGLSPKREPALDPVGEGSVADVSAVVPQGGYSALHLAAKSRHPTIVRLLIQAGASVDATDDDSEVALHIAARNGDVAVAEALLGARVDATCKARKTALHVAAERGEIAVVKFLLRAEVPVDAVTADEWTALHYAAKHGRGEVVHLLLKAKAYVHAATLDQKTALHLAAEHGHVGVVRALLGSSEGAEKYFGIFTSLQVADVEAVAEHSRTALHCAALHGHDEVVDVLLDFNADVDATADDNRTALHYAAEQGDALVAVALMDGNADVEMRSLGKTALHIAAEHGRIEVLDELLEHDRRADVDAVVEDTGETALHLAARHSTDALTRLLGVADVHAVTHTGETALHVAAERGCADAVLQLLDCGSDVCAVLTSGLSVLHTAAFHGHLCCVKILLEAGAKVDASTPDNSTALHAAAWHGHKEIVKALLCAHADPNIKSNHWTSLHAAAHHGHAGTVEVLLAHKADVNAVDEKLRTALHVAASSTSQDTRVFKCLLNNAANPDQLDAGGKTALDLAAVGQQAARDVLRPVTLWSLQPSHFEGQTKACALTRLDDDSEEFAMVRQRVRDTMTNARVTRVDRVQNRRLFEKYEFEKKHMLCRSKQCRLLFHGTRSIAPRDIYDGSDGFDMRFSKEGLWGKALYFAQDSSYSDAYKYARSDVDSQMFLAEVCIGDHIELPSDRTLTHAPLSPHDYGPDAPRNPRYNSVKGHTRGSDVYMVYSNSQAYPKYLITYTRIAFPNFS